MSGDALAAVEAEAEARVGSGCYDDALKWIAGQCLTLWFDTQRLGHICGSKRLDALCLALGAELRPAGAESAAPAPRRRRRFVYLVSQLYPDGGHTRILEDLIAAQPDADHAVVWTDEAAAGAVAAMGDVLRIGRAPTVIVLRGNPTHELHAGFALVDGLAPDVLVHLGHPNDPLTLALMQPAPGRCLVMVHIGDYSFALGRFLPGAVHVGLGHHFQHVARALWGLETTYLPLTCRAAVSPANGHAPSAGGFITATAGSAFKFGLDGDASYLDVLTARLSARSGEHVHFGQLDPDQLLRIEDHLRGAGWLDRFRHVDHVPSLASAFVEAGVALYLDSFPVGGAKTVVEAMAAGLPVCIGRHDPNLDGSTFAYPESLRWTRPAELRALLAGLDDAALAAQAAASRAHFARNHAFALFAARFEDLLQA